MEFPRTFGSRLRSTLQPSNTESAVFRPFSFGMDTVHPRSRVKLRDLLNAYPGEDGLHQRPVLYELFTTVPVASGETIIDFVDMGVISSLYGSFVAIGTSYIYASQDGVTWTRCPWKQDHYTATAITDLNKVTVTGETFQTDLGEPVDGMKVAFKDANGDYTIERSITTIPSEDTIWLDAELPSPPPSMDFQILYAFQANDPYTVQWTKGPDRVYLVDTSDVGILSFDGMYLGRLALHDGASVAPFSGAACVLFLNGYLVVGNVNTTNGYRAIYWSDVTDISNFQSINFVVLTLSAGPLFSLRTIENYIVAATQDDVYVGKPFSGEDLAYVMPWVFKRLETSGRVPVGQNSIVSALNAVFYVGQDDVYALSFAQLNASGDFVVTPLECPVRNVALSGDMHKALVMYEPRTECLMVAPRTPFNVLWAMNVRTKGWARWNLGQEMLSMARTYFAPRETYLTMVTASGRTPVAYSDWATAKLEADRLGNFTAGETVTLGTTVYTWRAAASVEGEVTLGTDYETSMQYLAEAINATAAPGHHACATPHPTLQAVWLESAPWIVSVVALAEGAAGVGIAVVSGTARITAVGAATALSDVLTGRSYQSFLMGFSTAYVVFGQASGVLSAFDFEEHADYGTTPLQIDLETGDMDFDAPADTKTLYRVAVAGSGAFSVYLYGSTDRGTTWKTLGLMAINNSEEELHFRLSGARLALKMQVRSIQSKMAIEELSMNLKVVSEHVIRGGN